MPPMIKHADELRRTSRNKPQIQAEVKDVLGAMYAEMVNANKDGRTSIVFPVPKFYASVGRDPDVILTITTTILQELVNGDYDVSVSELEHAYRFVVKWDVEISVGDKKRMNDLMSKHME